MRDIKLVEVRSEIAAGTRGASMGIDALKIASLDKKSDFFTQFDPINVPDANNYLWKGNNFPHAKYIDGVYQVLKNVYSTIESLRMESCRSKQALRGNLDRCPRRFAHSFYYSFGEYAWHAISNGRSVGQYRLPGQ